MDRQTDRQTDRRTDGRISVDSKYRAYAVSRGKNREPNHYLLIGLTGITDHGRSMHCNSNNIFHYRTHNCKDNVCLRQISSPKFRKMEQK